MINIVLAEPVPTANVAQRLPGGPLRYLRFLALPGAGTIKISTMQNGQKSAFYPIQVDEALDLGEVAEQIFIESTATGTVSFLWSLNDKIVKPGGGTGPGGSTLTIDVFASRFAGGYANVAAGQAQALGVFDLSKTRRVLVSLPADASGPVRIQGNSSVVTPDEGVWIVPGQSPMPIMGATPISATAGTIYAFNPASNLTTIAVGVMVEYMP